MHFDVAAVATVQSSLRRMSRCVVAFVVIAIALACMYARPTPAWSEGGVLTAGSNFSGLTFDLPQSSNLNNVLEFWVLNGSTEVVAAEVQWSTPFGIDMTPKVAKDLTLLPGQKAVVPFDVAVKGDTPAGEYALSVGAFRRDARGESGSVIFVPGVTQSFRVRVTGESATARIAVVDKLKREPVTALVSAARVNGSVRTEIARSTTDTLLLRAVPGAYEVNVFLDGRRVATQPFVMTADQNTEVQVEVEAIYISDVTLVPQETNNKVQAIEVQVVVMNSMRAIPDGNVTLDVQRDDRPFETLLLQRFAPLPVGESIATLRYVSKDGWKPGRYTFIARFETPDFSVKAATEPSYTVGNDSGGVANLFGGVIGKRSVWLWVALGLSALAVVVAIAVALLRRGDGSPPAGGARQYGGASRVRAR
jgi:hypothetical protein